MQSTMRHSRHATAQSGQIGVVILLIMVVILTVGLTVATRTTQETFLSTQSAESARVFNAAEAGIEQALSTDITTLTQDTTTGTVTTVDDTTVNYSITQVAGLQTQVFKGMSVALNVQGVTTGNGVRIQWSRVDCSANPASFLASIYSVNAGVTSVRYRMLGNCARGDGFEQSTALSSGNPYRFEFTLPLQTNDTLVRLQPIYNDTFINVTGSGWTLPTQYYRIRSEAINELGSESRVVEVNRTLPTAPSVMDYALYSGATLVQ